MTNELWQLFSVFGFFIALLFICGIYCILVTRSLLRAIIGIELLMKAVTLLLILVGYVTNQTALTQSLVLTVIVIEVVVVTTAGGVVIRAFKQNNSIDIRSLQKLKG